MDKGAFVAALGSRYEILSLVDPKTEKNHFEKTGLQLGTWLISVFPAGDPETTPCP